MFEIDEEASRVWDKQVILGSRHADVLRENLGVTDGELLGIYVQEVDVGELAKLGADALLTRLNPLNWPVIYTLSQEKSAKIANSPLLYEYVCVFARYRWYEENCRNDDKAQFLTVMARYLDEYNNRSKILDAGRQEGAIQQKAKQTEKARKTKLYSGRNPDKHRMFQKYFAEQETYKSRYAAAKYLASEFHFTQKVVYEWLKDSTLREWYKERPDWEKEVVVFLNLSPSL